MAGTEKRIPFFTALGPKMFLGFTVATRDSIYQAEAPSLFYYSRSSCILYRHRRIIVGL